MDQLPQDPKLRMQRVKELMQQKHSSFIWNPEENSDQNMGFVLFVAKTATHGEVLFDACITTLFMEYFNQLYTEAIQRLGLSEEEALDENNEEQEAKIAEVMEELQDDDSMAVCEGIEEDADTQEGSVMLEVFLHRKAINSEVVQDFVEQYVNGEFEPDTNFYTFEEEEPSNGKG